MQLNDFLVLTGAFLLTFAGCFGYRLFALKNQLIDVPSDRSSHHLPTPRGGGLVFVLVSSLLLLFYLPHHSFAPIAMWLASLAIAGVSYVDDCQHLSAKIRLVAQVVVFAVFMIGFYRQHAAFFHSYFWLTQIALCLAAFLFLLWMTNLFNFMDGINGLAAIEAIFVLTSIACLYYPQQPVAWGVIISASVIGFLLWNFPKAKLFMGDVGSAFLGAVIAMTALEIMVSHPNGIAICLILPALFITDATWTLLVRYWTQQPIMQAHCSHAYQRLSRKVGSHTPITMAALLINCVWLLPITWLVHLHYLSSMSGLALAYLPIWGGVMMVGAGAMHR